MSATFRPQGYTRIWCSSCEAEQALKTEPIMSPLGRRSVDLICADCHLIIATLHQPEAKT